MKYSTRLSDSLHILAFICLSGGDSLSSARIAESIQTNPAYVRQLMAVLKRAGLLRTTRGQAAPELGRSAREITLLDVYRAVEGEKPLLHLDVHTNPACGVGVNIQLAVSQYYQQVQSAAEAAMADITLQMLLDEYHTRTATPWESAVRLTAPKSPGSGC